MSEISRKHLTAFTCNASRHSSSASKGTRCQEDSWDRVVSCRRSPQRPLHRVITVCLSQGQTAHDWFKSYGHFTEGVDFAYWWSFIGKGLRLQPVQQACFKCNFDCNFVPIFTIILTVIWTVILSVIFTVILPLF